MDQEELINAYLEGTLSPEDQELFEKLLEEQPEYKKLLEEHKKVKIAITLQERNDLKAFLKEIDQKEKDRQKPSSPFKSWLFSGIAACLIVITGFFLWINLSMNPGEKLFKSYYETYPNLVAPTVRGDQESTLKSDAFLAFDNGDFENAASLFDRLQNEAGGDYAAFYSGICQLELGRPEKAIPLFQKVNENASQPDKITAIWFEALGYFLLNKLPEGKSLMTKVAASPGHPLQNRAQEILEKLK